MKKVNIAQLLKDCPKGTELYSPLCGKCVFDRLNRGTIICKKQNTQEITFTSEGHYMLPVFDDCECMLFPSRENRDWNNFYICPFKKGDFIVKEYLNGSKFIAIFSHFGGPHEYTTHYLCLLRPCGEFKPNSDFGIGAIQEARLATDSEKKELLDAIDRNGYYWDECSLTLKKLKFNINSLKSFDKVLVRDDDKSNWYCALYSHYRNNVPHYKYGCISSAFHQCIPYNEETKNLVGTTKDCPDYYKTW